MLNWDENTDKTGNKIAQRCFYNECTLFEKHNHI